MRDSGETGVPNSGSAAFAPFEAWSQWLRNNMGAMSATQGSTGEETGPEGATASDPLMSAMGKLSDANPMSNIIPLDWMEISKALQTLRSARCPIRSERCRWPRTTTVASSRRI